jgi:hypothetical protein
VTNAGWGKSKRHAADVAAELKMAGLSEANISTGRDHQKWVPLSSVANAAHALISEGICTLVTVEADTEESDCLKACRSNEDIAELLRREDNPLQLMTNVWMPFNTDHVDRKSEVPRQDGCKQLFNNIVFTPHGEVSACCGLTFEHIEELKIGKIASQQSFSEFFLDQMDDFLKIWIHVEGPREIAIALLGLEGEQLLKGSVHICQSCVLIHKNDVFRESLRKSYQHHVPRVMSKFYSKVLLASVESKCSPIVIHAEK